MNHDDQMNLFPNINLFYITLFYNHTVDNILHYPGYYAFKFNFRK